MPNPLALPDLIFSLLLCVLRVLLVLVLVRVRVQLTNCPTHLLTR